MINKEAAKKAAVFDVIGKKINHCKKGLAGLFYPGTFDPEKAFEQMSDWLENKKVAQWVMIAAVVYIAAQIVRAVIR